MWLVLRKSTCAWFSSAKSWARDWLSMLPIFVSWWHWHSLHRNYVATQSISMTSIGNLFTGVHSVHGVHAFTKLTLLKRERVNTLPWNGCFCAMNWKCIKTNGVRCRAEITQICTNLINWFLNDYFVWFVKICTISRLRRLL